ncbi:MAG: DMT family transporter [Anaerolineae bacterium]|nr:DMT family transporter [Anaerolineae bacterium]
MRYLQRNGLFLILISAAGYSFFPIFTKLIYDNGINNPLDVLAWRFLLAAPLTWAFMFLRTYRSSKAVRTPLPLRPLLAMGLLFGFVAMMAFLALRQLPVSLYTVLIYTYPAMVALGSVVLGERLSLLGWLALGLTLIGVVLTVPNIFNGFTGVNPLGIILVLLNAASYATYILASNRILRGQDNLMGASAWSISGSLVFVIVMLIVRGISGDRLAMPENATAVGGLIGLVVISTVIPIFTFYIGMQYLGAARAAIVSMIEPVLTLGWAFLLQGETLTAIQVAGAGCILVSVLLLQLRGDDRKQIPTWQNQPQAGEYGEAKS